MRFGHADGRAARSNTPTLEMEKRETLDYASGSPTADRERTNAATSGLKQRRLDQAASARS